MVNKHKVKDDDSGRLHSEDLLLPTREIFIHSHPDDAEDSGIDFRVANKFIKNLRVLEAASQDPIVVHQNTIGGDWYAGITIYDAIKHSPCKFVFVCHGLSASMGSLIAQSAHNKGVRITMPNCDWLIHEGDSEIAGTYRQIGSAYETERRLLAKMYEIYTEICKETGEYFRDTKRSSVKSFIKRKLMTKEDWWLTSEEAVYYGFADAVFGTEGYQLLPEIIKHAC